MQNEFIEVIVRKRPITAIGKDIVHTYDKYVEVHETKTKVDLTKCTKIHKYSFDSAFADLDTNDQIYKEKIEPNVYDSLNGSNFICYAYGQTGSGKTHTIFGDGLDIGLIPLTARGLFQMIENYIYYTLKISAYEIYNDEVYDLLNKRKKLTVREGYDHKIHITDLRKHTIFDYDKFISAMKNVMIARNVGVSSGNNYSSRSHAIFTFYLTTPQKKTSHITFVDLAGSERASQSICKNYRENSEINKSLLALKECIRAMKDHKKYIPFRSSKLTTVLQGAFTNCENTLMIGTVQGEQMHMVDTINTLQYTSDVKYIKKVQYKNRLHFPKISKPVKKVRTASHSSPPKKKKYTRKANIGSRLDTYRYNSFLPSLVKDYKKYVKDMMILSNKDTLLLNKLKSIDGTNHGEIESCKKRIGLQLDKKRKINEAFYVQLRPRV